MNKLLSDHQSLNKKGDFKLHSSKWVSFGGLGVLKWDSPINNMEKYTYSAENAAGASLCCQLLTEREKCLCW